MKKLHKKNGPQLPERQLKQLERGHELDVRAARLREAEERGKIAKKKRDEKEEKERAARKQMGMGLATQLIGYKHTQAQLKMGMEAFLGIDKRKEEAKRRRAAELTKKLEAIAQVVEKEPWDDDDDNDALDSLPANAICRDPYVDDELDDDTLLEAHDLAVSDPAPEKSEQEPLRHLPSPSCTTITISADPSPPKEDSNFTRLHGPVNRLIETVLKNLPGPLVELLSEDLSLKLPDWDPAPGLLHKLNPVGLPPHRLRVKVGSIVTLLRDLNTSSQLSKSQHLRIIRAGKDRLECLVLDGQLEGTKAFLTRVSFPAKYRKDLSCPFQRTQFPVRVTIDFTPPTIERASPKMKFKLPNVPSHVRSSSLAKRHNVSVPTRMSPMSHNPTLKLPGLPASRRPDIELAQPPVSLPSAVTRATLVHDGLDDFLDSGTQIARELSADGPSIELPRKDPIAITQSAAIESIPPLSTQDFDFSMEDLDESPAPFQINREDPKPHTTTKIVSTPKAAASISNPRTHTLVTHVPTRAPSPIQSRGADRAPLPLKSKRRSHHSVRASSPLDITTLRPSQRPPSVSDRPGFKRKTATAPSRGSLPPPKRPCAQSSRSISGHSSLHCHGVLSALSDFGISTQEVDSFFSDDDDLYSGSPPIAV